MSEELKQVGLSSLSHFRINDAIISSFRFYESKSTPMCPEELTYEAKIKVSYKDNTMKCTMALFVKKVESWKEFLNHYTVKRIEPELCERI